MKPKKALGQNFLGNPQIIKDMANTLEISMEDEIIEIGSGRGAITFELVKRVNEYKSLDAYEIDTNLANILSLQIKNAKVKLRNEDFLDADLSHYQGFFKVIGAIPYYITSPIIHKLLEVNNRPDIIVLLI